MLKKPLDLKISIAKFENRIIQSLVFLASSLILYALINTLSNDVGEYLHIWELLKDDSLKQSFSSLRYEPGFLVLFWYLASIFSANTTFYLTCLLSLSIKYYLFNKYLHYSFIAFALYLLTFAHILDANQVRAALAACVIFYAIFVTPRSKYTYLILSLVAILFHYSGVIILSLYFVNRPVIPLVGIIGLGFLFDIIISSSAYFKFAIIWLSAGSGEVNLTSSIFIMQLCIAFMCAVNWRTLSEGQKRGALLNMVGVVTYIAFLDNPIVAHRIRELSQLGIFGILFLGKRNLSPVKFVTWICFGYIFAYNILLISTELASI